MMMLTKGFVRGAMGAPSKAGKSCETVLASDAVSAGEDMRQW